MKSKKMTIKELRQHLELTQKDFAKMLNIARVNYSNIENGKTKPSLTTYQKIKGIMEKQKLNIDDLIF